MQVINEATLCSFLPELFAHLFLSDKSHINLFWSSAKYTHIIVLSFWDAHWLVLLNSSLFSELNRAAAAAPPTPLPGHHSPGLIPQAGGLTAALQRAAEQTSTVTPKRAVTGIPPSSSLSTARLNFVGDQDFVINQTGGSLPPSAQLVILHNPPITFRAHLSVNARRSLQKRK